MKKYLKIFAGILATALITTGCQSYAQTGYNNGYYNPTYGYNYNNGYGDGQPGNNYYYDNQQPDPNSVAYQPNGQMPVGFNDFYNQLSPYGTWVNMAPYGPVWVANVPNFQPYYSNGYWAYTNYGWTWVSNYSWGWAPFHYGRWGHNSRYGWYWVPGYAWGPAWVAWSSSADMYGWAPLMPGMNFGVSLSVNLFPSSYWTFMPGRYMGMNNIGSYYVNRSRNVTIIKNTTIINNYGTNPENNRRYTMGPNTSDVQRYTGRAVQSMRVTSVSDNKSTGISDNELRVYRPVTRTDNSPSNNRTTTNSSVGATQTRTQPAQQPANRVEATQTRTQPAQQPANKVETTQTRSAQPVTRQNTDTYRQNPAQPKVTNSASPQTTKQIQAAQKENEKVQQQRSATPARSNTDNTRSRR